VYGRADRFERFVTVGGGAGDEVDIGAGLLDEGGGVVGVSGLTYCWSPAEVFEPVARAVPLSTTATAASAAATGSMWSSRRTFAIFKQGGSQRRSPRSAPPFPKLSQLRIVQARAGMSAAAPWSRTPRPSQESRGERQRSSRRLRSISNSVARSERHQRVRLNIYD
jgi:hypothetical protein